MKILGNDNKNKKREKEIYQSNIIMIINQNKYTELNKNYYS